LDAIRAVTPHRAVSQLETLGADPSGESFVRAVATQHRPLIELFFASGVDVNGRDAQGRTALLAASVTQDQVLIDRLLGAGADPRLADRRGRTPLMIAAMHGDATLFRHLLERGADPRAADENGHTALHYAVAARQHAISAQLLSLDLPVNAPCCEGQTLLTHALTTRDWQLIEPILTRHPAIPRWSADTRALLAAALNSRDAARIRLLLIKHNDPPTPEGSSQPLLAWTVARGDYQLCHLLLDCGADPNTPVITPAGAEFMEALPGNVVKHYLESEPGMTALMLAAGLGRPEFVKLLLEKGAARSATTRSKYKLMAIYFAAWAQSPESIQLLIGNAPPPDKLRVEISLAEQRARLIKDGVPILSTGISSGRAGFSTPEGRFVITDKHESHMSTIYKVKMPFFMRLNCRDFGMHEGYVPDYPASHGCIRLPSDVARRLYREVPIGTLVTIAR
jgi:ankyrin repeat protein